ncbi:OLC1v1009760C1 [Oldenlandia corymbosa var. corymbosa]|uniref:OLC1v1009760C1 n=1 Tax=Oldenlandia corymbosa var. corymbosa TaxID=529605 RepID=A0AAV1DQ84_OLDCO|nr:OLC1v1009760C1 [Oldenlandia corymbosa var. corymbosa]
MSDGGGGTIKEAEINSNSTNYRHSKKKRSRNVDITHSVARVAVAQLLDDAGFQSFQLSALDALADVAVRYICDIGKTANLYANLAGRSQCNLFDVIQGLEDLGSVQGFPGASDVHRWLSSSGVVREVGRYIGESEEIPFAYSIPGFPVVKAREPRQSFAQTGMTPPSEHIPSWLPVFPDPKTYVNLHSGQEKALQNGEGENEQVEKDKDGSKGSVNSLQKITNGSDPSVAVNLGDARGKRSVGCNPFLAPPVQAGEKEVSPVVIPAKLLDGSFMQGNDHGVLDNHISVLDTFAPAIEGLNNGSKIDPDDGRKDVPFHRSSTVKFKIFGVRKSSLRSLSVPKQEVATSASWLGDADTEDDTKKRAEQILKQSFESDGADTVVN